ncbi:MAG: N-acetyltransferase family protein [Ewingella sp.]|uniref:GNAT family N-acetyltransferase n=1 Tax=Ewingella TaxID=41201 RepID=UPI003F5B42C3
MSVLMRYTITLHDATIADMVQVQAIYAHHVIHGIASFETEPPTLDEMLTRREKVLSQNMCYLVAKRDKQVLGYCYLAPYRPRYAYRFTCESSVYIAEGQQGLGIGKRLMQEAIRRATEGGWRQMIANVGNSENLGSIGLHQSLGFQTIGTLKSVGFKHGRWVDTVLLQLELGEGDVTLPSPAV